MKSEILKITAVLDRYEGDRAVLLLGPDNIKVVWPRELLPGENKEGQIYAVTLAADHLATALARREAEELLREIVAENEAGAEK